MITLVVTLGLAAFAYWKCLHPTIRPLFVSEENGEQVVFLVKRTAEIRKIINLKRVYNMGFKTHAPELVYTGATVGGIHTGGFHVNEGYTQVIGGGRTDRFHFMVRDFKTFRGWIVFDKIVLPTELIDAAQQHPIVSKFLQGNALVLKYDGSETRPDTTDRIITDRLMKQRDLNGVANVNMKYLIASKLTKEDANAVLNWLCGEN